MTTRILLVRHGATILTAEDRFAGSTDVPLSEEGRQQVRQLAARLAPEPLTAIYASPMARTLDTAGVIAVPHRLPVRLSPGLREIDHGHWEGLTRHEAVRRYPAEYAAWEARPIEAAPVGGESGRAVLTRARAALDAIVSAHPGEHVLVVSHKATIRLLVADLFGLDLNSYRTRLDQQPAALNILDVEAGYARLVHYNDVSHNGPWHEHTDLHSASDRPHADAVAESHRRRIS
jgi:broad specificity phosphatase PhoE